MLKTYSIEQLIRFDPWYTLRKFNLPYGNKKDLNALDILKLNIPAEHRLWFILSPNFLPDIVFHKFGCSCADEALKFVYNTDPRIIMAIEAKRKWIDKKISYVELNKIRGIVNDIYIDSISKYQLGGINKVDLHINRVAYHVLDDYASDSANDTYRQTIEAANCVSVNIDELNEKLIYMLYDLLQEWIGDGCI